MIRNNWLFIICAICVFLQSPFWHVEKAQDFESDLLARRISPTVIKGETIEQALSVLSDDYGIPMGIETGDESLGPARKIDLKLQETTVEEFLNSVVAKDPQYTWKLEGGIIHVWPLTGRDPLLTILLDTKVSPFAITSGSTRYRVYHEILNLPEIKVQLSVADVAPLIFLSSGTMRKVEKDLLFTESNLTLREVLDRMATTTDIKRWVLMRWGKNSEFVTLRS